MKDGRAGQDGVDYKSYRADEKAGKIFRLVEARRRGGRQRCTSEALVATRSTTEVSEGTLVTRVRPAGQGVTDLVAPHKSADTQRSTACSAVLSPGTTPRGGIA